MKLLFERLHCLFNAHDYHTVRTYDTRICLRPFCHNVQRYSAVVDKYLDTKDYERLEQKEKVDAQEWRTRRDQVEQLYKSIGGAGEPH